MMSMNFSQKKKLKAGLNQHMQ